MENIRKYAIICTISIILIIPIFFEVFIDFLFIWQINIDIFLILLLGLFGLLFIGKLIEIFVFNSQNIEIMKKHDVINALIKKNNKLVLWIFFPITMIMEELIFRYYLISVIILLFKLDFFSSILISSIIFSLYHIHTWFFFKNLTILIINLIYSFILGLFNGFVFLTLGLFPCIIFHSAIAFFFYYNIFRRYFKMKD